MSESATRSDGIHCDQCGYMDCECVIEKCKCRTCGLVEFIPTSHYHDCTHCGAKQSMRSDDGKRWMLQPTEPSTGGAPAI